MDVAELRPRQRDHAGGAIELHGTAAQGYHSVLETQILRLQVIYVAKHLCLGVVRVEHRMGEEFGRSPKCSRYRDAFYLRKARGREGRRRSGRSEDISERKNVSQSDTLVQGNTDKLIVNSPEIDTSCEGGLVNGLCTLRWLRNVDR